MTITHAVGWALIAFLWQGTLIGLGLAALVWLLRNRSAQSRYLVLVVGLFSMPFVVGLTALSEGSVPGTVVDQQGSVAIAASDERPTPKLAPSATRADQAASDAGSPAAGGGWRQSLRPLVPWLVPVWLIGVAMLALRHLVGWRAARRLTRHGVTPAPDAWRATLDRLAHRLGVRQPVALLTSTLAGVPAVVGMLRPVILIPMSALSGLPPDQLELLLAHELAHVRRWDYLVNVLQSAVEALLFYHPVTWWVSSRIREEREHCCDDLAVAVRGDAVAYAEALVAMEGLRQVSIPAPALAATGGSLLRRIRRLLRPAPELEVFPRWSAGALVSFGLLAAAIGVRWADAETKPAHDRVKKNVEEVKHAARPTDPALLEPDTVIRHPNPEAPLAERFAWAERQVAGRKSYWIGYSVAPFFPGGERSLYVGRMIRFGSDNGSYFSGRMVNVGRMDHPSMPGVSLVSLVGGRPDETAILFGFGGRAGSGLERVQASSAGLPVDFERRTLIWLGSADDDESVALVKGLWDRARSVEVKGDLIAALGVHRGSELVVPLLVDRLQGNEPDAVRKAAAEWIGWHSDRTGLGALARAARTDRSESVRHAAAESVGDLKLEEAADTLVSLARTLDDHETRRRAVEALGQRPEPSVVAALVSIAHNDPDAEVRRHAVEALGELKDRRGVPALLELAKRGDDREVRRAALEAVAEAAEPAAALETLAAVARDETDEEMARRAVEALGDLADEKGMPVVRDLAEHHPSEEIRRVAMETLADKAPEKAFELLDRAAREDKSIDVRRRAVESMIELKDERVVPSLVTMLEQHTEVEVQRKVVESLAESKDPKGLEAVARAAERAPDEEVRSKAIEAYADAAPTRQTVDLLKRLIASEKSEDVQHRILGTLADLDGGAGTSLLIEIAKTHPDKNVRRAAIKRLADVDDEGARDALIKLIEKP